jgi:enoyl-CoA hydratase/carnithine racemase
MRLTDADAPALFAEIERLKRAFRTLETLGIPVVACLNGSALGGGWEVALARTTASPSTTPRPSSACPRSRWA